MGRLNLVTVRWVDTSQHCGWIERKEGKRWAEKERLVCDSAGWLVFEDKTKVVLAPSKNKHHYGDLIVIPRTCIEQVQVCEPKQ